MPLLSRKTLRNEDEYLPVLTRTRCTSIVYGNVTESHRHGATVVCIDRFSQPQGRVQMVESKTLWCTPYRYAAGLLLLFAAEALVFYAQMADQIAPFFPTNFDQTGYINYTYQLFETIRDQGWASIVSEIAHPPTATGTSLIIQGALIALLGGPNRTTIVSLNLIYFVVLQLVVFQTIRARTRSPYLALIAIALLLSMPTIFSAAGGIFDFRMDFVAFCLYGIWACLIIWSRCLAQTRITAVLTAVAILLIATRSITVIYVGGVLIGLLVHSLIDIRRAADPVSRDHAACRARNIFWSGGIVAIAALPLLFAVRRQLYEKYVVGHVLNDEKYIRAQEVDVHTIFDHILFYPKSVLIEHIGQPSLWLVLAVTGLTVVCASRTRRRSLLQMIQRFNLYGKDFVALIILIIAPISVLTIDISKSAVVGGIVVVAILLAEFWSSRQFTRCFGSQPIAFLTRPMVGLTNQSDPFSEPWI